MESNKVFAYLPLMSKFIKNYTLPKGSFQRNPAFSRGWISNHHQIIRRKIATTGTKTVSDAGKLL
jgi:hypothetical protein